jgi:hypothetical protein
VHPSDVEYHRLNAFGNVSEERLEAKHGGVVTLGDPAQLPPATGP